ncbi:EthD domain-containing protein [Novosphingobium taihuense]|uniref:EthD domain-containing protein n=1 Tax=Novosphingobium taihuense TaxID=260085 RepID=A0A7W7EUV9_9SPHN|nr:EthD domain-containing protein [Novosphingobium taihuense]MBB4614389.1 hypothetical protein [Novosphingobium taihuense]TWH86368.1 EthD domain-containing protein [Novosphingobium taihuense]
MITIHYCLHRKPGMNREDFAAYWRGPHAELVKSLADTLRIVRYVQNHGALAEVAAQMQAMRNTAEPFDGVAAITFDTPEDLVRGNTDPAAAQAQARLAQDEAQFIDIARSSIVFTTPLTVIG